MTRDILTCSALDGLPSPAFMVRMSGRPDADRIARLYRGMVARTEEGTLNTVLDRRGTETTIASLDHYIDFFGCLYDAGIRRYRAVVVDADPNRRHMAAMAQEAAKAVGLDARISHVWSQHSAVDSLRRMMAEP